MLKTLLKKSSLYFITLVIGKFLTAGFFLILARKIASAEYFGLITFFVTMVQLLNGIADFGLKNWYQKQIALTPAKSLLKGLLKWRLLFFALTAVVLVVLQTVFTLMTSGFVALLLALALEAGISVADGYYLSCQQSLKLGWKLIGRNLLLLPVLFFINQAADYQLFYLAYNFSLLLTFLGYFPWQAMSQSSCSYKKLPNISSAVPFALIDSLGMLYNRLDHLLIKNILGPAALGSFGIAYRYLDAVNLLPQALFHNLFPLAAKKDGIGKNQLKKLTLMMLAIGLGVGGSLYFASPLLTTWILGAEYALSEKVLQQLTIIVVLFFFNAPLNTIIQSSRYLKFYVPYLTLATLINLLSNVLLLPRYNLFGAVMAMLISEISLVFINLKFIYLIYHPCQNYAPKDPNKVGS